MRYGVTVVQPGGCYAFIKIEVNPRLTRNRFACEMKRCTYKTQTNSDTQTKRIIPLALNATDLKQH